MFIFHINLLNFSYFFYFVLAILVLKFKLYKNVKCCLYYLAVLSCKLIIIKYINFSQIKKMCTVFVFKVTF